MDEEDTIDEEIDLTDDNQLREFCAYGLYDTITMVHASLIKFYNQLEDGEEKEMVAHAICVIFGEVTKFIDGMSEEECNEWEQGERSYNEIMTPVECN